jgi:hypothetical protein
MNYVCRHGKKIAVDTVSTTLPTKKHRPFQLQFVKLPYFWIERLEQSRNPGTFKLAHRILIEQFKCQFSGGEIILSTDHTSLSRKVRSTAVKELVGLGLIQIEQHGNQAVRVTKLIVKERNRKRMSPVGPQRIRDVPLADARRNP